jgi:hypothetical protein
MSFYNFTIILTILTTLNSLIMQFMQLIVQNTIKRNYYFAQILCCARMQVKRNEEMFYFVNESSASTFDHGVKMNSLPLLILILLLRLKYFKFS